MKNDAMKLFLSFAALCLLFGIFIISINKNANEPIAEKDHLAALEKQAIEVENMLLTMFVAETKNGKPVEKGMVEELQKENEQFNKLARQNAPRVTKEELHYIRYTDAIDYYVEQMYQFYETKEDQYRFLAQTRLNQYYAQDAQEVEAKK